MALPLLTFRILLKISSSSSSVSVGRGDSVQKYKSITFSFPGKIWALIVNLMMQDFSSDARRTYRAYLGTGGMFTHAGVCSVTQSCEPPSCGYFGINPVPRAILLQLFHSPFLFFPPSHHILRPQAAQFYFFMNILHSNPQHKIPEAKMDGERSCYFLLDTMTSWKTLETNEIGIVFLFHGSDWCPQPSPAPVTPRPS